MEQFHSSVTSHERSLDLKGLKWIDTVHVCHLNTWEAEARGSEV